MLDDSPSDLPRRSAARRKRTAFLCAALALAASAAAGSSDAPPPDPASGDDEAPAASVSENVVVSATRVERSVEDVPLSVTVIGRREIEQAPSLTPDDLLRNVPGVNMPPGTSTYLFPTTQTFSMRGTGARRSLVLLDGVPATDPFSGAVEWNKIPVARLDRVEVVRGGGASLFGSQALGGLVNFVTRPADGDSLEAEGGYGSYASRTADFSASRMATPELGIRADGSWFETDGFQHESPRDRGAVDIPMAARRANGRVRADWSRESFRGSLSAGASTESLSLGTPLSNQNRQIADLSGRAETDGFPGGTLALSGYYQRERVAYDNTAFLAGQGRNAEYRANNHQEPIQAVGGSLLWTREGEGFLPLVVGGVDVQQIRGDDRSDVYDPAGAVTQRLIAGGQQTFTGVFAEASFVPAPAVEILANARYDFWRNFDGHQIAHPGGSPEIAPRSEDQFDPRLAARVAVAPGLALRAAGYRSFRAPTLRELYYQTLAKTQQVLANPALGPEHAWGAEAGADFARGAWTASATAFVTRIEDIIGQVQLSGGAVRVLQSFNVGNARSEGIEASLDWSRGAWNLRGTYAYTESKVTASDLDSTLAGKWIAGVPRNAAGLSAAWHDAAGRSAALRFRSYSRQYGDASNRTVLDPATLVDAEVRHPLWGGFSASASCTNVFDRRYIVDLTSGRRLGDPRLFLFTVRWRAGTADGRPGA